jgi:hypothetical protein
MGKNWLSRLINLWQHIFSPYDSERHLGSVLAFKMNVVTREIIWVVICFLGEHMVVIDFFKIKTFEIKPVKYCWSCIGLVCEKIKVFVFLSGSLIFN